LEIIKVKIKNYWFVPFLFFLFSYLSIIIFSLSIKEYGILKIFLIIASIFIFIFGFFINIFSIIRLMHYKIIINQDNIIINSIFKKNRSLFNSISIKINKRNIKYYKYLNGHIYIKLINENEYIIPEIYFTKKDIDIILKYFK